MSLAVDGVWKSGVWDPALWADGVWREGEASPEPEAEEQTSTGGFWFDYDREMYRRDEELKKRERLEAESQQIKDRLDREIAQEYRKKEAEQSRLAELHRLAKLANIHQRSIKSIFSDRALVAAERAITKGNYSALEAFEREVGRAREEEFFLMQALMMVLND